MQGVRRSRRVLAHSSSKIISSVQEPIILSEEEVDASHSPINEVVGMKPVVDPPSANGAASSFSGGVILKPHLL